VFFPQAFPIFMKCLLSVFAVGDCLLSLSASESFSLGGRWVGNGDFLVVRPFPIAFSLNPGGFSLAFAARGAS
jgi:hypothetical protein